MDDGSLTLGALVQVIREVKSIYQAPLQRVVLTGLLAQIPGGWEIERDGKVYLLMYSVEFTKLISAIPMTTTPDDMPDSSFVGTIYGIPVTEDEDLARGLIVHALRQGSRRACRSR